MNTLARTAAVVLAVIAAMDLSAAKTNYFPEKEIPRFNVPKMPSAPAIDGVIDGDEWRHAVRIMGMATAHNNVFRGRPHVFWVSWDEEHIYLAARAHVLKGHTLLKSRREAFTTGTVFDDAFEFGISMEGRNQPPGEVPSFFKFILNSLKAGEYLKMYPSIGQYLYNWQPDIRVENRFYEDDSSQWWDTELALDLADLEMPVANKAGDLIRLLLAHDGKNPGWQWTCVPSASGYLVHDGYPRATLTDDRPYVQVEELDGLHDERLQLRSVIHNPGKTASTVAVDLRVRNEKRRGPDDVPAKDGVVITKALEIPAGGSVRFDVDETFPGFVYGTAPGTKRTMLTGAFRWTVREVSNDAVVYNYHLMFAKDEKKTFLKYTPKDVKFELEARYNPVSHVIWIAADTLDARLPDGGEVAGAVWAVRNGDETVADGRITQLVYWKYQDLIQLPALAPGTYTVAVSLVDDQNQPLVTREIKITKKNEAEAFPEWWGKTYGDHRRLLKPFTALRTSRGKQSRSAIHCTRRTFELDSLGLPVRLVANGGEVLAAPARVIMVVNNQEFVVPTRPKVKFTDKKDWRVAFEGAPAEIAGVRFAATGFMEQDGLVSLALTIEPSATPVEIQELRIEWPVDDTLGNHIACMGVGGNYSARFIGAVPAGQGEVWSSQRHIGKAGSGMTVGNFMQNLWLGTEQRGFLWYGTSDEGWVPNDDIAAHTIVRDGATTTVRNHIVGTRPGSPVFALSAPRTIHFSYNASPFKHLTKGWRINQRSAANGFSEKPKYKWNWDTGKQYFSVLSPPFAKRERWAEYYAHCQEVAGQRARAGIYSPETRLRPYLTNQIATRGYERKSTERDIYNYFAADWETLDSGETLNQTYRDYMMWLQHRQIAEGGCRHFYYDISMCGRISRQLVAGNGYLLPDGRIQPTGTDWQLRRWYQRATALMQEHNLYPAGVSGHATNTIPLVALPFSDAMLDSEFPMKDPISVFPSERMIALSVPHAFGCNINHLGFMNPAWAAMHDAGMGGGHNSVFDRPAWRSWGIERSDIDFVPYWRNGQVVRRIADGLICSIWKRPGSAILGVMNYGPDKEGYERTRACELNLDMAALGVPVDVPQARIRIRAMNAGAAYPQKYVTHLPWYEALPGEPFPHNKTKVRKFRPNADVTLNRKTGDVTGFDIFYHDQYFLMVTWDADPVDDHAWQNDLTGDLRTPALDWGIATATEITGRGLIKSNNPELSVRAWHRSHSVMLLVHNTGTERRLGHFDIDIKELALDVPAARLWHDFVAANGMDGKRVKNVLWSEDYEKNRAHEYTRGDLVYDGHLGKLVGALPAGEKRLLCIDRY